MWQRAKIISTAEGPDQKALGTILWVKAQPPIRYKDLEYVGLNGEYGRASCAIFESNLVHQGHTLCVFAERAELLNEFAENVEIIEI